METLRSRLSIVVLFVAISALANGQTDTSISWRDTLVKYIQEAPYEEAIPNVRMLMRKYSDLDLSTRSIMYETLSSRYEYIGQLDSARYYADKYLEATIEKKDTSEMSFAYLRVSTAYKGARPVETTLQYLHKAEEYARVSGDSMATGHAYTMLASLYYDIGQDSLRGYYSRQAYNVIKELDNPTVYVSSLINLGTFLFDSGEVEESFRLYREARQLLQDENIMYRQVQLREVWAQLLFSYENIEPVNHEMAFHYADTLCKQYELMGAQDDVVRMKLRKKYHQYELGQNVDLQPALDSLNALDPYSHGINMQYVILGDQIFYNKKLGNFEKAFEASQAMRAIEDSLSNRRLINQIAYYREEYEAEKREDDIRNLEVAQELAEYKISQKNKQILILVIGLTVLILFAIAIYIQTRRIRKVKLQLEQTNKIKDRFFAIIGHDLRSPLIALQQVGGMLNDSLKDNDREMALTISEKIVEASTRLNDLTANLIEWALIESNELKQHPEKFTIDTAIYDATGLYEISTDSRAISLKYDLSGAEVYADKSGISTVMRNIVGNAVKFSSDSGEIAISSKVIDSNVVVTISDNGQGIREEKLERLNTAMENRIPVDRTANGIGLGLIVSRDIIKRNNGKLEIKRNPDGGTTVVVTIPAAS